MTSGVLSGVTAYASGQCIIARARRVTAGEGISKAHRRGGDEVVRRGCGQLQEFLMIPRANSNLANFRPSHWQVAEPAAVRTKTKYDIKFEILVAMYGTCSPASTGARH